MVHAREVPEHRTKHAAHEEGDKQGREPSLLHTREIAEQEGSSRT